MTNWAKKYVKKQRGKDHWTVSYAYAGRRGEIHIWKNNGTDSGAPFMVYAGANARYADTFEEATEVAQKLSGGAAIAKSL